MREPDQLGAGPAVELHPVQRRQAGRGEQADVLPRGDGTELHRQRAHVVDGALPHRAARETAAQQLLRAGHLPRPGQRDGHQARPLALPQVEVQWPPAAMNRLQYVAHAAAGGDHPRDHRRRRDYPRPSGTNESGRSG
ncbi:hypothetical protein [Lentzea sp. NBRC 102530]|uniref:hypothetical protein n=1 Tax=Lentzea sp. NBRC 102530 TaxID=3032201 RepID=UPI00249FDF29|nr:hypothetical protein [Lentzea sp. NBRC 102530]GLY47825.1 hypothetical protein Lesp01_14810 [Lentzea sp. NBRC 102530]